MAHFMFDFSIKMCILNQTDLPPPYLVASHIVKNVNQTGYTRESLCASLWGDLNVSGFL